MFATRRNSAAALAAATLFLSSAAWAQVVYNPPSTPPPPDPPRTCGLGKPLIGCTADKRSDYYSPFNCDIGCDTSIVYCQNPTAAPVPDIECRGSEGGFVCYGSPQSITAGLTYNWSGLNLTIDQPDGPRNPYVYAECRNFTATSTIALTVTTAMGASATVTKVLNCLL